jgi:GT2 family glycosyltransferase
LLLKNRRWSTVPPEEIPYERIDFQHGASLLVRLAALSEIGVMDERYFLYFEEHDWQHRAQSLGWNNRLIPESVVHHLGSMSTQAKKHLFFFHYNRSAIIFTRSHFPPQVRVVASLLLLGITLIRSKLNFKSLTWGMKGLFQGWMN